MDEVRIGVVGVGGMGWAHAQYLMKGDVARCRLAAVCDVEPARLEPFTEVKPFADSRELIRSGLVDAVLVATPHYDHTTIGIDAFEQGLHVLVEKPISVHKADAERLIAAHRKSKGRVFAVMFNMRTNPAYKRIKRLVANGELGEIQRVNWIMTAWFRPQAYYDSGGWRATWKGEGGGLLMNQCPHNLDMLQWICGMPKRVRAFCPLGKYHDIEVEDEVTAYFEYANGGTGVFISSTGEAPGTDRLEIVGDRGRLVCEDGKIAFVRNEVGAREFRKNAPGMFDRPDRWNVEIPIPQEQHGHAVVTQSFVNAILDGAPLMAPGEEGIHSVEFSNAMLYSSFTGRTVELPLDAKAYEEHLKTLIATSQPEKRVVRRAESDITKSFR